MNVKPISILLGCNQPARGFLCPSFYSLFCLSVCLFFLVIYLKFIFLSLISFLLYMFMFSIKLLLFPPFFSPFLSLRLSFFFLLSLGLHGYNQMWVHCLFYIFSLVFIVLFLSRRVGVLILLCQLNEVRFPSNASFCLFLFRGCQSSSHTTALGCRLVETHLRIMVTIASGSAAVVGKGKFPNGCPPTPRRSSRMDIHNRYLWSIMTIDTPVIADTYHIIGRSILYLVLLY